MHYLIFIPNKSGPNKQHLKEVGLGDLGTGTALWADLMGRGPSGDPGQIWTWGDAIPAYLPDQQTWIECRGFWYGYNTASPPRPSDLVLPTEVAGMPLKLGDGQTYVIPSVKLVPTVFDLDDNDEVIKVPHPSFRWFVEACERIESFMSGPAASEAIPMDFQEQFRFTVKVLGINYRICQPIAIAMGLFNEQTLVDFAIRAVDFAKVQAAIKANLMAPMLVE